MKFLPVFLLLVFITNSSIAQSFNYIKGKIVDGETGVAIPNASIFITNTTKGTVSNSLGEFELTDVPAGSYDLVASSIGYETQVYSYKANQLPLRLLVKMQPKPEELEGVTVEPFEKDGWEKWGNFFIDNFIGTAGNPKDCSIKNYKSLRFRNSKKKNQLTVISAEPLMIENKALGYTIQYQLEEFSYNFKSNTLVYFGYALFNELHAKGPKSWQLKNRETAYSGSITHFMRSLYHNQLAAVGFEVKRLVKTTNLEKERVKKLFRENAGAATFPKDSSEYYNRVFRQPDMLEAYGKSLLTSDSLLTPVDSITKNLSFGDFLYIVYKKEKEDPSYLLYTHENRKPFYQRSVAFLPNGNSVLVDGIGNYYMPQDFMSYGYWAWSEKIRAMLPLDYKLQH